MSRTPGRDRRRLALLLSALFLLLALPTSVLTWQAARQLRFEAFHLYRTMAEELAARIDGDVAARVDELDALAFGDFAFLVVTGDPAANFLQRSPLSAYPPSAALPGVLGYFQVNSRGDFSSPLLPEGRPDELGIPAAEYEAREALADELQRILADNRLLRERPPAAPSPDEGGAGRRESAASVAADSDAQSELQEDRAQDYGQEVFDRLNTEDSADRLAAAKARSLGKLAELGLETGPAAPTAAKEHKDEVSRESSRQPAASDVPSRSKRYAQEVLPATAAEAVPAPREDDAARRRIVTFESEIDPFEASLLQSGHLVLFRNVWLNGERYVQGVLVATERLLEALVAMPYRATALSAGTDLVVAYHDEVIRLFPGESSRQYGVSPAELDGALLYQHRLVTPLDGLGLVFSVTRLPPGPGANVLFWNAGVIAVVFIAGFLALYRLGAGQIRLAQQQQDFVSAVSHELKTPLTSIRMYGEMLLEGWVSESRKRQYYQYIHDEAERLARLIANVLQLARITRNAPEVDLESRSAGELLDTVASKVADPVQRAGYTLAVTADDATRAVVVDIDEDAFVQIIINLVDNAIKFSGNAERRAIEIGARISGGWLRFFVRDFGHGIARDQMKKIFELFYRAESELTRETVGTGIGLAIVRQLVQAMGGRVDVVNCEPGAEFRVDFPRAPGK